MVRVNSFTALAAIAVACSSSGATGATGTSDLNAALFGLRESAIGVGISPGGNEVVYVTPSPSGGAVAFIANVQTGDAKPFLKSGSGAEKLRWCSFVTEQRLVCRYGGVIDDAGLLIPFSRLIAVNSDGSDLKELGQSQSFYDAGYRQYDGDIIDWLPGSGGSVLMQRNYIPESGRGGTRMVRRSDGLGVDRVDTNTGKVTVVEGARRDATFYLSDGIGNVRVMGAAGTENGVTDQQLTGKTRYFYRPVGSHDWKVLIDYAKDEDVQALAVDPVADTLYLLKPLDGRKALYRMKLDGSGATELVASHPKVDIDDVVRSANGQKIIGYTYTVDRRQVEYFDPEYKALAGALAKAVPNLPLVRFEGANTSADKILMFAGADNDPGRYFVFDKRTKSLAEIMLERPDLENRPLALVKPISVGLPDGVTLPAYLTLPPGKVAKDLPAVVLPHGGPASRDQWGFDWLAQYLAAKGYAVLQPEYRGSAGFGDGWLLQNGFKSWRTSIGDITASARWLAAQGIADQNRIAIVGWSYGGYAALQSAATEPSLFKAVVAIAPVTDLDMLKQEASDYTNAQVVADYIGSGPNISEGSPLRHAAAIKAPVLLVHGDMDWTVRVAESEKMDAALAAAGDQVSFLRFKGLDHQLADSDARIEMLTEIGKLLEKTIGH
ncbi:MAG TPA: alpha/beta fold hydrolase [Sphingomicrobium sp.]|jgi:dienelactone hydrolase